MDKISNAADLKEAIKKLEQKQAEEWKALKAKTEISLTGTGTNPLNVLKSAMSGVVNVPDPEAHPEMWSTALSLLAGYGAKKLIVQNSENQMRNLVGTMVQFGITNLVANNSHIIKMAANRVIDLIITEKKVIEPEVRTENQ